MDLPLHWSTPICYAKSFDYAGDRFWLANDQLILYLHLQPRYIQGLIDKAKQREREHEIIYERKLAKERSQDEHLYADKDKFVTSAYKKKLAEQAKWIEEERLRELREQKDDVSWTHFFSTDYGVFL